MEKWQLDALNFEVKAIETFLGITFEGETVEQKQEFVVVHKDKRTEVTSKLLRTAYEDYKELCRNCFGYGRIENPDMSIESEIDCPTCKGNGHIEI